MSKRFWNVAASSMLALAALASFASSAGASVRSDARAIYRAVAVHDRAVQARNATLQQRLDQSSDELERCFIRVREDIAANPGNYAPPRGDRGSAADDFQNLATSSELKQVRARFTAPELAAVQRRWRKLEMTTSAGRAALAELRRKTRVLRETRPLGACNLFRRWAVKGFDVRLEPTSPLFDLGDPDSRGQRLLGRFTDRSGLSRSKRERLDAWPSRP